MWERWDLVTNKRGFDSRREDKESVVLEKEMHVGGLDEMVGLEEEYECGWVGVVRLCGHDFVFVFN